MAPLAAQVLETASAADSVSFSDLAVHVLPPEPLRAARPAARFALAARIRATAALNLPSRDRRRRRTAAPRRATTIRDALVSAAATKPKPRSKRAPKAAKRRA